jgi:hypothetical protein
MKYNKLDEYDLLEQLRFKEDGSLEVDANQSNAFTISAIDLKGKFTDVASLFPTVVFYDRYPIGDPQRISKPLNYVASWFGFVHCKLQPPRGPHLPMLPYKQKTKQAHKLLFGLCRNSQRPEAKCINRPILVS